MLTNGDWQPDRSNLERFLVRQRGGDVAIVGQTYEAK